MISTKRATEKTIEVFTLWKTKFAPKRAQEEKADNLKMIDLTIKFFCASVDNSVLAIVFRFLR